MNDGVVAGGQTEIVPETLDPFSYFLGAASKITGLGGTERRADLAYGFHTHYVLCAPGHCTIRVQFTDLKATHGLIHLRIHMLSTRPGSQAKLATVERVYLADLAEQGGEAIVRFESLPGMLYAMFGQILDTTDATASGLTVVLDRPGTATDDSPQTFEATAFGNQTTNRGAMLSSADAPTFAQPVSQVMTRAQLRESAFVQWQRYLPPDASVESAWEQAFVLQTLDQYGMLDQGAAGIGFGVAESAIPVVLARRQCALTLVCDDDGVDDDPAAQRAMLDRLPAVDGPNRDELLEALHFISPEGALKARRPHDFAWSMHALEAFSERSLGMQFVEDVMGCLRPGGLAVHVTNIALDGPASRSTRAPLALARSEIERLALTLISYGHSVAQIRFDLGDKPREVLSDRTTICPFGLIVRRS